jgi:hypothetical protein
MKDAIPARKKPIAAILVLEMFLELIESRYRSKSLHSCLNELSSPNSVVLSNTVFCPSLIRNDRIGVLEY